VRFERHLAQSSWTKASMASLWTGLYPQRTGITRYDDVLPEAARMPAEILREAGFETVGLFRNGWVAPTFGFDQGFEVYLRPRPAPLPPNVRRENPTITDRTTDAGVIEAAGEFLRVSGGQRWFLYLHLMDLHEYIYDAESALFGSSNSGIYDNSIRWTDGTIEILLEILSDLGLREKTLIAIASDHGEAFLERGFEGHAREVFRESTEVPFVVSFPFRLDPGVVVKARTQNVDIWPTLLDMLGLAFPGEIDGRSRLPEILANLSEGEDVEGMGAADSVETAIAHLNVNWGKRDREPLSTIAVVEDSFRYVRVEGADGAPLREVLFDASLDPRELRDWAELEPDMLERLRAVADEYYEAEPSWGEAPTREISELELNLLRALGYELP
jgi:arylsulfatase A-like enzyme